MQQIKQVIQVLTLMNLLNSLRLQVINFLSDQSKELQYLILHLLLDVDFVNLLKLITPLIEYFILILEGTIDFSCHCCHKNWFLNVHLTAVDALLTQSAALVGSLSVLKSNDRKAVNSANLVIVSGFLLFVGHQLER